MARANDDPRTLEILSGHAREGGRLEVPHAAFVGLPFVGRPHADGHLIGMAMVLPRSLTHAEAEGCTRALAQCLDAELRITLRLGARGTLDLQAAELNETRHTLRVETWCGPSRGATTWATVTPIVLDRLPPRRTKDIEGFMGQVIARACERVGLPAPAVIRLSAASRFLGAPHAAQFPAVANKGAGGNRWHVHAMLEWGTPVRGPVLIGAGRYRGLGFLRPWHNKEQS
jgi:CRISPR-associated protein Csb2